MAVLRSLRCLGSLQHFFHWLQYRFAQLLCLEILDISSLSLLLAVTETTSNNQETNIGQTEKEFKTRFNLDKSYFK